MSLLYLFCLLLAMIDVLTNGFASLDSLFITPAKTYCSSSFNELLKCYHVLSCHKTSVNQPIKILNKTDTITIIINPNQPALEKAFHHHAFILIKASTNMLGNRSIS